MPEYPTIANIVAQIAIAGSGTAGQVEASADAIVDRLISLGVPQADIDTVLQRAIDLGVITRRTGARADLLAIGS